MIPPEMRIRQLGSRRAFHAFDDDNDNDQCAWCEAAWRLFVRQPKLRDGDTVHLENDRGNKRTVTCTGLDPMQLECEPYVFFRDDD